MTAPVPVRRPNSSRPVGTDVAPRTERRFVLGAEGELMTAGCGRIGTLVMRMQSAFLEDPELTLTLPHAQRRFGVDEITCQAVLGALADAGVLANVRGGAYVRLFPRRAGTGALPSPYVGHAA